MENDPDIARQKAINACNNNPNLEVYNTFDANSWNILQNIICDDSSRQAIENSLSRRNFNWINFPWAFWASKAYVTAPLWNTNWMFFNCSDIRAWITSWTELRDIPNAEIAILFEQNKYRDGHNWPRPCEWIVSPTTLFVNQNLSISDKTSVVMPRNWPWSLVPPSGFLPVGKHNPAPQVVPIPPSVPMHSHPSMFMPPIIAPFGGAPAWMPHTPFVAPRGGKGWGWWAWRGFFPQAVVPFTSGEGYQPNPNHYIPGVYRPWVDAPAVYQPIR